MRIVVSILLFLTIVGPACSVSHGQATLQPKQSGEAKSDSNPAAKAELSVIDLDGKSHDFKADDLKHLPRHKFKAKSHDVEMEFEGVALVDLLKSSGVAFGDNLKGQKAASVALCEAADGYRVPLALLEIDPDTTDKQAFVVDQRDGKPLDAKEGPFRLVVPDEKRPIRWIRMLKAIRIINLRDDKVPAQDSQRANAVTQPKQESK